MTITFFLIVAAVAVSTTATFVRTAHASPVDCGTSNTPSVIALADPNFYIDSGISPALNATYGGYTVRAGTTAETNLRIVLSNFTGGVVSLATNQPADRTLPGLIAGDATTAYFLFKATGPTVTPQVHTISLYRGADYLCERTFTYARVAETIKALANKVDVVTASTAATAQIGDELVVTVEGHTGTLGAGPAYDPGVLSYAPAAINGFPVNAWRLEKTSMTISPDGVAPQNTYIDRLYLSGASGPDRDYVARYTFRAIDATDAPTTVKPVQYIASGTQVKHTDLEGSVVGSIPKITDTSKLAITKSVASVPSNAFAAGTQTFPPVNGAAKGGTVRYTVSITNSGGTSGSLDRIVDTMDAGITFTAGTATINNRAKTPTVSGRDIIFYGPITIPAGGTTTVVYDAVVQDVTGDYKNSVVGWYGNAKIDGSTSVNNQSPASTTVKVAPASGTLTAKPDSTTAAPDNTKPVTIPVTANDEPLGASGLTVSILTDPIGGTAVVSGTSIVYTPSGYFGGTDTFKYSITNGFSTSSSTVTVSVPKAVYDEYVTPAPSGGAGSLATFNIADPGLLTNDTCSKAPCQVFSVTVSGSLGTFALKTSGGQKLGGFDYSIAKGSVPADTFIPFTYVLIDADGNKANGNGRFVVSNFGPDRSVTAYKTKVRITVTTNDSNCSPSPCAVQSVAPLAGEVLDGTISKFDSNNVEYTPNSGFVGVDRFSYSKGNADGEVKVLTAPPTATMTSSIGSPTSAVIGNTSYITTYGQLAVGDTAKYDCTGCTYSVAPIAVSTPAPTQGSVTFTNPNTGAFTYTPISTAKGSDTFYYTLTEPSGLIVTSSVTIRITPKAQDDAYTVLAKNTLNIDVLTNDTCPDVCTVTVVNGSGPASGTLTPTGGGTFTYVNSSAIGDVEFQYRISSTATGSETATAFVKITVQGAVNDTGTTSPGVPLTMNIRANDPCDDCSLGTVTQPPIGVVNINTNGTVTYISPSEFSGIATFTYTVSKGGKSTSAKVTVTVKPDAKNDSIAVLPNTSNNVIDVLNNDVCADCVITAKTDPADGTVTISSDKYSILYNAPASGGPFTFTYEITDVTGEKDTATVTVIIAVGPTVVNDSSSTLAGRAVSINTRNNDTCRNSPCTIEIATDPGHGNASLSVNDLYDVVYTPNPSFTGIDTFKYSMVTSVGLRATATVTVVVSPLANNDSKVTGINIPVAIDVLENDTCTTCTVNVIGNPSGGTINSIVGGTVTFTSATPGTFTFDYKVIETNIRNSGFSVSSSEISAFGAPADPAEATATATVIVGDASPDEATTPFNPVSPLLINVIANDTCRDAGCSVTKVNVTGGPAGDSATIVDAGAIDTTISYTPEIDFEGLVTISYTATYGLNTADATVTILVGPRAKTQSTDKNTPATGNLLSGMPCATCVVTFKSFSGEGEIQINPDGSYVYTPRTNFLGPDSPIIYTITDSQSLSSPQISQDGTLTISVLALTPSILLTKSGVLDDGADNIVNVGDHIDYSYVVENTYDTTLTNITVTDDKIDNDAINIDCPAGGTTNVIASLAVGPSNAVTCVAKYYITQADIDSGRVTNIGTANGPATDTDTVTIYLTRIASTSIVKSAGAVVRNASDPTRDKAGDTITYSYKVTNTGNVTLTNLTVVDDKIDNDAVNIDCPSGGTTNVIASLAPGSSVTCVAIYTLTASDISAESVTNTATVTGTAPTGAGDPSPSSSAITVLLNQPISLSVDKTVTGSISDPDNNGIDPGDVITYSFLVTNTSTQATLTSIAVVDSKIPTGITCSGESGSTITSLAPSATRTCTGTYAITQADIDAGAVINTATVSSNYNMGGGVVSTIIASDTNTRTLTQRLGLTIGNTFGSLTNSVIAPNTQSDAGDKANFSYVVTNTGNVTLTSVLVSGTSTTAVDCGSGATITSLAPAEVVTCTAAYTIKQSELNAGSLSNTGNAATSFTVYGDNSATNLSVNATASTNLVQTPDIQVTNVGSIAKGLNGRSDSGETATFTYTITNLGNVTLGTISVTSSIGTVDCDAGAGTSTSVSTLAPAATAQCVSTYLLTQPDINSGQITDTASVSSTFTRANSTNVTVSDTDPATVTIDQTINLSIVNSFTTFTQTIVAPNDRTDTGDKANFSYLITNTGNVTLATISITSSSGTVDCDAGAGTSTTISSLAPGESHTCATTSTLTLAQVNAGSISDTGDAASSYTYRGDNSPTSVSKSSTASRTIANVPALDITTSGVLTPAASANHPNDTIVYTYTVTNTGNITLSSIDVTVDNQAGDSLDNTINSADIDCAGGTTNQISTLAPGESVTCLATYSIDQADINRGIVRNHVVATASNASDTYEYDKLINQSANLTIDNTARPLEDNAPTGASTTDTVTYDLVIKNTGNVTLTNIAVTLPGLTVDCPTIASLAPGASVSCVSSAYTLTSSDITAGSIVKTAQAQTNFTYYGQSATTLTRTNPATTYLVDATVLIAKSAQVNRGVNARVDAGDTISYTFTVTNTGGITLTGIEITDVLLSPTDITCAGSSNNTIASLAIGAVTTCSATYVITQANVDLGSVTNVATASSGTVTDSDTVTTPLTQVARLTVSKWGTLDNTVVSPTTSTDAGDKIEYRYLITNTGNVTLSSITVTDDKIANDATIKCPVPSGANNVIASLAPGVSVTCGVDYVITSADVTARTVVNVATVAANQPSGSPFTPVTDTATVSLTAPNNPGSNIEGKDDTMSAPMGSILEIDVLKNDSGSNLTIVSASQPSDGSTEVRNGLIVLTPSLLYTGTLTFNYVLTDGTSVDTAAVIVRLTENLLKPDPEIFLDINANGIRDTKEPGIKGISMDLSLESRSTVRMSDGGKAVGATSVSVHSPSSRGIVSAFAAGTIATFSCATVNSGFCSAPRLPIGSYKVKANFDPTKFGLTTTADSDGGLDLEAKSVPSGDSMSKVQFGVAGLGSVAGRTYIDHGNDKKFDAKVDTPLPNSTVDIIWAGIDGILGTADDVTITERTDANGRYSLSNVPVGTYSVRASNLTSTIKLSEKRQTKLQNTKTTVIDFHVQDRTELAATGTRTETHLVWAMALLLGGAALLLVSRRRRSI